MQASAKPPMSRLAIKAGSSSAGQAGTEAYGPSMQGWRIALREPAARAARNDFLLPLRLLALLRALTSWLTFFLAYFFLACDLKDRPRRIAFFLMNAGGRPVSSTTSSSDFEARPSSISRRSSLNDQCLFRIITKTLVRTKPSSGVCSLDDFAVAGPDLKIIRSRIDIRSDQSRNKCRALS
jgi:hypothetical protein